MMKIKFWCAALEKEMIDWNEHDAKWPSKELLFFFKETVRYTSCMFCNPMLLVLNAARATKAHLQQPLPPGYCILIRKWLFRDTGNPLALFCLSAEQQMHLRTLLIDIYIGGYFSNMMYHVFAFSWKKNRRNSPDSIRSASPLSRCLLFHSTV